MEVFNCDDLKFRESITQGFDWASSIEIVNREFCIQEINKNYLDGESDSVASHVVHEIAKIYRVDRTLNFSKFGNDILQLIRDISDRNGGGEPDFSSAVDKFSREAKPYSVSHKISGNRKNSNFPSAASKLLQFSFPDESCIYDLYARIAIKKFLFKNHKNIDDIKNYIPIWNTLFRKIEDLIDERCKIYTPVRPWTEVNWNSIFFRRRIFDKILFNFGKLHAPKPRRRKR
jgi:hypothetical protein